ncbi:MAG: S-layer homology domain-containing protein, partial [Oscillospiraceae bacterium]|nr:S-layer homology domain-containing protein [Oscillospiraceae bacterium]
LFKANGKTTRAEFAKIIVSAFGFYDSKAENTMLDNPDYWWAYRFIGSAVNAKIASGYSAEWFGAKDNITRQDVAVMLVNAIDKAGMKLRVVNNNAVFEDNEAIADYAKQSVRTLQMAGIVQGDKNNNFYPKNNAERAEIAVMIYRVLNNVQN